VRTKKSEETGEAAPRSSEEKEVFHGTEPGIHCSLWRTSRHSTWIFPKELPPWRAHAGADTRFEKEEAAVRKSCALTMTPPLSPALLR